MVMSLSQAHSHEVFDLEAAAKAKLSTWLCRLHNWQGLSIGPNPAYAQTVETYLLLLTKSTAGRRTL